MAEEVRNGDDGELVCDMSDIEDMSDSPPTDSNSHASNENSNGGEKCSEIFGNGMNNVNDNVRHEEYMEVDEVSLNKENSLEGGASNDNLLDSAVQYIAEERADQVFKSTESGNRFISGFSRMENQNEEQNANLENLDLGYFFSRIERFSNVLGIRHILHVIPIHFIIQEVGKYIRKTSKEKDRNTSKKNSGNTSKENGGNTSKQNGGNTSEVNVGNTSEENGGNTSEKSSGNTSEKNIINTKESNIISLDIADDDDDSKKLLIQAWKPLSKLAQNVLNSFKFEDGKVKFIKIPLGLEVYRCTKNCFYFCNKAHRKFPISIGPCAFDGRATSNDASSSTSNDASSSTSNDASSSTSNNASSSTSNDASSSTLNDASSSTLNDASSSTLNDASSSTLNDASSSTLNDASSSTLNDASSSTLNDASSSTLNDASSSTLNDASSSTLNDASSSTSNDASSSTSNDASSSTSNDANASNKMVPDLTEICYDFLSLVKTTYKDYPDIYDSFLNTLMNHYILRSTESEVVEIATHLFAGNSQLLQKFYNFLDKKNKLCEVIDGQNGSHSLQNATYKIISGIPPSECASQDTHCKLIYPLMCPADIKCLEEGKLLNDAIINFYLQYLYNEVLINFMKPKVLVINTFFFTKFSNIFAGQPRDLSATVKAVQAWFKNIDLFSFKYLMIPVNISDHWVLVIIHLQCKNTTLSYDMFFLDSIVLRKSKYNYKDWIVGVLHSVLCIQWSLIQLTVGKMPTFKDTILKILNVPQQVNKTDCGVYVMQYAEDFCKLFLTQATDLFSFSPEDMVRKRHFLKQLVLYFQNKEVVYHS